MSRIATIVFWLVLLPFLIGAGAAESPKPLTEVPEDYRPKVTAPSLDLLAKKTSPTLQYEFNGNHLFLWAQTDKNGQPSFSLASANLLPSVANQPPTWALFEPLPALGPNYITPFPSDGVLPQITLDLTKRRERDRYHPSLGASIFATHPKYGTVYALSFHLCANMCGFQEYRAFLLQSNDKTWHLLAMIPGVYTSDEGYQRVHVVPRWTKNRSVPIVLKVTTLYTEREETGEKPTRTTERLRPAVETTTR